MKSPNPTSIKAIILLFFLALGSTKSFSQWKFASASNIKDEINIIYDVIYERKLSQKEKESPFFRTEHSVVFNKNQLLIREFPNKSSSDRFTLLDYKNQTAFSCSKSANSKTALKSNFKNPKKIVTPQGNGSKNIVGVRCERGMTIINGKPKDIYYTKSLGLRYCKNFDVRGFLLEYPGYNKTLGPYKVVARSIERFKFDPSYFSLDQFNIMTHKEYKESRHQSSSKYNAVINDALGNPAPKFSVRTTYGERLSNKSLEGKIVVLNFWFTTCAPCKLEIPKLNELRKKYQSNTDVKFVAVALDDEYKIDAMLKYIPFEYKIVSNGRDTAHKFKVPAYPTNMIIDKNGNIQFFEVGYKSDIVNKMEYHIDKILKRDLN